MSLYSHCKVGYGVGYITTKKIRTLYKMKDKKLCCYLLIKQPQKIQKIFVGVIFSKHSNRYCVDLST